MQRRPFRTVPAFCLTPLLREGEPSTLTAATWQEIVGTVMSNHRGSQEDASCLRGIVLGLIVALGISDGEAWAIARTGIACDEHNNLVVNLDAIEATLASTFDCFSPAPSLPLMKH